MVNRRVLTGLGLLALLAGCTALLGINKDYVDVGRDSGATDGTTMDGTSPTVDGASDDSAFDASLGDGGSEGGLGFCATLNPKPTFCDDFDLGNPVGAGWSNVSKCIGCTVAIDNDASVSPPLSILAINTPDGSSADAYLRKVVVTTATQFIAVQADLRMDKAAIDPASAECALELGLSSSAGDWRARLLVYPTKTELEEYEFAQADASNTWDWAGLAQFFSLNLWVRVRIEVDLMALTSTVYFNGAKVLDAHPLRFKWPKGTPSVVAGDVFPRWNYTGNWAFRVDNVVLDEK